jgi:hypothetical protein
MVDGGTEQQLDTEIGARSTDRPRRGGLLILSEVFILLLLVAGVSVVRSRSADQSSTVGLAVGTAFASPRANIETGGALPVGDWLLLAAPPLDNNSKSTIHIKSVTADVPASWKTVDARAYSYQQLGGWPMAWPQTAVGAAGDPTSVKATPVADVVCPPSTRCPYFLMVKVVPSKRGDFHFGGMDLTYEVDGTIYTQHLDVLFGFQAT